MSFQVIYAGEITPQALLIIWGVLQSLALEYVPYLKDWYGGLDEQWKRFSQAISLAVIAAVVMLLACYDILGGIACDQGGFIQLFFVWISALVANQTTHKVFKKKNGA